MTRNKRERERKRRKGTHTCDALLDQQEGSFIYMWTRSTYNRSPSLSGEVVAVTVYAHCHSTGWIGRIKRTSWNEK
jgi:hypothetical protein